MSYLIRLLSVLGNPSPSSAAENSLSLLGKGKGFDRHIRPLSQIQGLFLPWNLEAFLCMVFDIYRNF